MKSYIILFSILMSCSISYAQVQVDGYFRSNGTYVEPHYRSSPDGNPYNNYSYPGNYNPYTGKIAGGNETTYLNNYYKVYSSYSAITFQYYSANLTQTNFSKIQQKASYDLRDNSGNITGYVRYSHENIFKIFNFDNTHIGYLEKKSKRRYKVYDVDGYFILKGNK